MKNSPNANRLGWLAGVVCMAAAGLTWADPGDVVNVPSLGVKERLHALEQINVTAATVPVEVDAESARVQQILDEAEQIESEPEPAQRASH